MDWAGPIEWNIIGWVQKGVREGSAARYVILSPVTH